MQRFSTGNSLLGQLVDNLLGGRVVINHDDRLRVLQIEYGTRSARDHT
ncbi:hypothetical protein HMPREF9612_01801 [Cutibacterium acnes HL063PA2]|nr:hypothetical protein HMPREF9612_01801 [Cutibacterium acnes HL063PA2]